MDSYLILNVFRFSKKTCLRFLYGLSNARDPWGVLDLSSIRRWTKAVWKSLQKQTSRKKVVLIILSSVGLSQTEHYVFWINTTAKLNTGNNATS